MIIKEDIVFNDLTESRALSKGNSWQLLTIMAENAINTATLFSFQAVGT